MAKKKQLDGDSEYELLPFSFMVRAAWRVIGDMSDEALERLSRACKKTDVTNCPAPTFCAAQLIEREVEFELRRRAHAKQQEGTDASD